MHYSTPSQRVRRQRLKEQGLCTHCGKNPSCKDRITCDVCRKKRSAYGRKSVKKRKLKGQCIHCSNPTLPTGSYCLKCWFGNTAINHFSSRRYARQLEDLWRAQKGRCAYTGEKLLPGVNASLDHIEPVGKCWDRKNRIAVAENKEVSKLVQWVTKEANTAKNHMSHREFVRFCKKIANRF